MNIQKQSDDDDDDDKGEYGSHDNERMSFCDVGVVVTAVPALNKSK